MSARSLRRWKIATGLSVACCAFLVMRGGPGSPARAGSDPARLARATTDAPPAVVRKLRVDMRNRDAEDVLLGQLARTTDPRRLGQLCQELGFVGGARSVPALVELSRDPRWSVASSAIQALGRIATPDAVTALIDLADGPTWQVRRALTSLADANTDAAIDHLTRVALASDTPHAGDAIDALGAIGDRAIDTLKRVASAGDPELAIAAIGAASRIESDAGRALVIELAGSADRRVRATAMEAIRIDGDGDAAGILIAAVGDADPLVAAAAAAALGNARHRAAVPALVQLAGSGGKDARAKAMEALANIGDDESMQALTAIAVGDGSDAEAAARVLSSRGDEASSTALLDAIAAQPDDRAPRTELLTQLEGMPGEAVDDYFLDLAQNGDGKARLIALAHLDKIRHPETVALAVDAARRGQGRDAVYLLAGSDDPAAYTALLALAKNDDPVGAEAISSLASRMNGRPEVTALLGETLRSGRGDQLKTAATALAEGGTPEGRAALLDALRGPDRDRAAAAAGVLLLAGGDAEVNQALIAAARGHGAPLVRAKAIAQLVSAGDETGAIHARAALLGTDRAGASDLIDDLKRQDGPQARALLEAAARDSKAVETRAEAIAALASGADATSMDLFTELATDDNPAVREKARGGLADIDSPDSIAQLIAVARSTGVEPRDLVDSLRWSSQPAAHAELARVIRGGDSALAVHAIETLYSSSATLDQALRGALASDDREVARAAASRLREIGAHLSAAERARLDLLSSN